LDPIPVYKQGDTTKYTFSGYRESRGLYKIKGKNIRINADVNGAYNNIRKVAPNAFDDGVEGFAVIPMKVTFHENKKQRS
jgi:putative transposase